MDDTQKNRQLLSDDMLKQDFLSRISHEMRTPMNAIIGMTRMALQQNDADKMKEYMRRVESSAWHLLEVINDMLDVVRMESGDFTLSHAPFTLKSVVQNAVNRLSADMHEKGHTLQVDIGESVPAVYMGDSMRLAQVFFNLLSNAVKFTPPRGEIALLGRLLERGKGRAHIEFSVKDNGIGIKQADLENLFQVFGQLDGGMNRKYEGTGLGLVITRRIVEMMDGSVRVQSVTGQGSTFTFDVWLEIALEERGGKKPSIPLSSHHILVADDNEETLLYIGNMLNNLNVRCDMAHGGAQAVKMVREAQQTGKPYTVVLLDWRMPGIDGIEAARRIDELTEGAATIVMITMGNWQDIEDEAREAGVSHFLPKPITVSALVDVLSEVVDVADGKTISEAIQLTGKRILLADDIRTNQDIAAELLKRNGALVQCVDDGAQALERFSADPQGYDLLILDIDMPGMDGLEAARRIRALPDPRAKTIPLLALTARTDPTDRAKAAEAGLNAVVAKPLDIDKLYSEVNRLLSTHVDEPKGGELPDQLPGLDVKDALSRLRGNKKLLSTLLTNFLKDPHEQDLALLIDAGDTVEAEKKAHAIKGAAGNLGLTDIFRDATTLDMMLKNGEDKERCSETLATLMHGFDVARETAKIVAQSI